MVVCWCPGLAWRGKAWHGLVWRGRRGWARHGMARPGMARLGMAWEGRSSGRPSCLMRRFIWHAGDWHEVPWTLPAPRLALISDAMQPTMHMASGELMDSKSAFRRVTRDRGFVEVGSDAAAATRHPLPYTADIKDDVRASLRDWRGGYRPEPSETVSPDARTYK